MAAIFRAAVAGGTTTGSGPPRTVAITPVVGDLLAVFCSVGASIANNGATDNQGGTYTNVGSVFKNGSVDNLLVFIRDQLVTSAVATTISIDAGTDTAMAIGVIAMSGMSRTGASAIRRISGTPQLASQANQAGATTPAPVLPGAALTGNPLIGCVANTTSPATLTPPASWTERVDNGFATPTVGLEVITRDSGFTGTTVTWGGTSASAFASFVMELDSTAVPASAAQTIPAFTQVATVTTTAAASAAQAIPAFTQVATAVTPYSASAAQTIPAFAQVATLLTGVIPTFYRPIGSVGVSSGNQVQDINSGPITGDLLVLFLSLSGTTAPVSATDNKGGTYTLVTSVLKNGGADQAVVLIRDQLIPSNSLLLSIDMGGPFTAYQLHLGAIVNGKRAGISAIRTISGVPQVGVAAAQLATTTPAASLPAAALTSNITVAMVANGTNPATLTPPASWTEQSDTGQTVPNTGLEVATRNTGFTGTTITWGSTSASDYAVVIAEIDTSAPPALAVASQQVPDFTQAATVTSTASAAAAQAMPAFAQAATVTSTAKAAAAQTIPAFSQVATAVQIRGDAVANQQMPAFAQTATATTLAKAAAAQAIPAFGQVATASVPALASVDQQIPAFAQAATAIAIAKASAAQTIGAFGQVFIGTTRIFSRTPSSYRAIVDATVHTAFVDATLHRAEVIATLDRAEVPVDHAVGTIEN